jgi:mannose-6-phosphate isomerase-like protein (cupin superfamily)
MYLALSRRNCSREAAVPNQPVTGGYVVGPGEGVPGRGPDVKASGRSTGGSLTVIEATIDGGPPRHTHSREDESFYLLAGTLDVECGEDRFRAGPGSLVFLPRNLPHVFRSVGGPATALLIVTPGGQDEYFAELAAALAATSMRPSCGGSSRRTASRGPDRRSVRARSVPQGSSVGMSGHRRSPTVRRNRRSPAVPLTQLGRRERAIRMLVPTVEKGRSASPVARGSTDEFPRPTGL